MKHRGTSLKIYLLSNKYKTVFSMLNLIISTQVLMSHNSNCEVLELGNKKYFLIKLI